jgi:hypothetical protein
MNANGTNASTEVPPPAKLFTVLTKKGEEWQLGGMVPGSDQQGCFVVAEPGTEPVYHPELQGKQALQIMSLYEREDGAIEVFAAPVLGSIVDQQQMSMILTLYPETIERTTTVARNDEWRRRLAQEEAAIQEGHEADLRGGAPEDEEVDVCEKCDVELPDDAHFCPGCGMKLTGVGAAPALVAAPS